MASLDNGRAEAAADALQQAATLARAQLDTETLATAIINLARAHLDKTGNAGLEFADEAVAVLSKEPADQRLMHAITELSAFRMLSGDYAQAIVAAERSLALANELGLPPAGRALMGRAGARCSIGDAGGLADGRKAIELSVASGAGGSAAIGYNNLGIDTFMIEGPEAALTVFEVSPSPDPGGCVGRSTLSEPVGSLSFR